MGSSALFIRLAKISRELLARLQWTIADRNAEFISSELVEELIANHLSIG
jgi:hypothetical protein